MAAINFRVKLSVRDTLHKIDMEMKEERVHQRLDTIEGQHSAGLLIYEKYYMRNSSRASLTVYITDFQGETEVEVIPSGGSQGMFFNIDWGAGDSFSESVQRILKEDLIDKTEF